MFRFKPTVLKSVKIVTASPAWRNFATYKTTTGLAGLPVDPNGRDNLIKYSKHVLENVEKIPACGYRESVEQWYKFILKTAHEKQDIAEIEDEIGLGNIEEVIQICKGELSLIEYNYDEKIWERVERSKKNADELVEKMADSIFFAQPLKNPKNIQAAAAAAAAAAEAAKK